MKVSTQIYRREKRDGRNPSTGTKSKTFEERKKEAEEKRKKFQHGSPSD